jgi:5-methylthioadenosine/S-adenosylhomocysteine deaminase
VPVTTHAGVWGATNDDGIRLMHEHGFMTPRNIYVHAATLGDDSYQRIAATGGSVSVATESEQSCGQGYPPTWVLRSHDIPVALSMDTSVWWSGDLFSAMRSTLGADRAREHLEAHAKGDTVTHCHLRADQAVEWATLGGARALGLEDKVGSLEPGKKADVVLIKNDDSPVMFPILNPYGHVAFQAQRADVHTVIVNGRVVKQDHRLLDVDLPAIRRTVESTVEYLRGVLGEEAWAQGMNPDIPQTKVMDNPYTYTDYRSATTHEAGS